MVDVNNADVNILDYNKVDFDRFLIAVMWTYGNNLQVKIKCLLKFVK